MPDTPQPNPPTNHTLAGAIGARYTVTVAASRGGTEWSPESPPGSTACTPVAPPAPNVVTASCQGGVLTVEWDTAGTGLSRATIYKPRIFTSETMTADTRWTANAAGTATSATIPADGEPDLPATGTFQVKVKAANTAGDSGFSDPAEATCGPPGLVSGVDCTVVSDDSITIEWNPVVGADGYQVVASIWDVASPLNANLLGWEDAGIPRMASSGKFVFKLDGLDSEVGYYLGVRARNSSGLGDLGSGSVRQCETIDDDWFVVRCTGNGVLAAEWSDPSGDLPEPSKYSVTAYMASASSGSGVVGTYSGVGLIRSWLVRPNQPYLVEVATENAFGGPVYAKAKRVKCPLLSSPDWNSPNNTGSAFWDRVLAAIRTLGNSGTSSNPIEITLAPITIGVEQYYYTDYQIALASRTCKSTVSDGHTTQTCDEVWDERIEVRLDKSSLDQVVDDAITYLVPDITFKLKWESLASVNTLLQLYSTAQGTGYLGSVKIYLPRAALRSGQLVAAALIIDFTYHDISQPRALISGMSECWYVLPKDRGSDIKSWKSKRYPIAGSPNSPSTQLTAAKTLGNVTTIRNAIVHYCDVEK
ncbi:hypothetical protein [Candidatus Poriferisocius sp.]|uniref:hypothetical protein n=1 Tax=Candidatus Poriferisocius sp. TaxID=3101276 RepID=UPI003B0227F1